MRCSTIICIGLVIAGLMFAGPTHAQIDPETILGIWLLDEGTGDTTKDASGNGNDGTLMASPAWISGAFGNALDFSGTSSYVNCGNAEAFNVDLFSVSFWCYIPNTQSWNHMISRGQHVASGTPGSVNWGVMMFDAQETILFETFNDTSWLGISTGTTTGEWHHVVATYDGDTMELYHDGQLGVTTSGAGILLDASRPFVIGARADDGSIGGFFDGSLDEVGYFNAVLSPGDVQTIMNSGLAEIVGGSAEAADPQPANGQTDVPRDLVLGWTAGMYARTHDVYFGTAAGDVGAATAADPRGVLAGPGLTENAFDPGRLDFGATYYWRVDEVNAPPDSSVFAGPVWSFTVEPYTYPIQNVTATASSATTAKGMTPGKTVDGSGMTGDEHSTQDSAMWLSGPFAVLPAWIQYEFDDVYKLSELWVWNSNQTVETFLGFGARDVTVEYSLDGIEWSSLGDVEFAQAPGELGYTPNTTVDLAGVRAKFVRLTITSNWMSIVPQVGLSEVRFYYIPVKASQPNPASGARGVPLDVVLTWRSGREATSHDVYFSDDRDAVVDGTAPLENVTTARFEPTGLEFGLNYYWKVDEVSDAGGPAVEGDVWSLATTEYMVVDDFESYTDDIDAGETIWQTWLDGLTNNTGSIVGYWEAPFAETSIVHSGRQSMPMDYNNVNSPFYSEAERTFDPVQDWTVNGADELSLWYHGYPVAFVENADGSITMSGSGHDIWDAADDFRLAYQRLSGDGSIVARVDSLANTNDWAKAGVMIRESLSDDARCAYMVVTPANGVSFQWRAFAGVTPESVSLAGIVAPQYVKLTRKGDVFTAQYSADGSAWQDLTKADGTAVSVTMTGNPLIGLCVTSHDASLVTTAEFAEITSSGTGPWQVVAVGDDPEPGNDADDLYVVIQDSSNKTVVVTNPDPAAVNANAWTEWKIPLSDLAGVNLTRVETMYIGVGDRDNPQPDGAGRLFIDDIRVGRPVAAPPVIPGNFLTNGGFEDGVMDPWSIYGDATAEVVSDEAIEGASSLHITVNSPGVNFWDAGLQQAGYVFQAGKQYTLSAFLKCSEGTLDINFKPELAADPWTGYGDQVFTMTDEWTEFSVTTPVFAEDTSPGSITFHIGFAAADFWIDGVRFYEGEYVAPGEE